MAIPVPLSVIVLAGVFLAIAVRQVGRFRLQIWQIVLVGATVVLVTRQISIPAALSYIDPTVILFLLGIFIVGEALTESGYLQYLSYRLFRRAKSVNSLVFIILFAAGLASMFLLNDTLAVIGTPVIIMLASSKHINLKLLLLALAFGITTGSVMSPIGNPQNLLIASSGIVRNPFPTFFSYLIIPTILNLLIAYAVLRLFYREEFKKAGLTHDPIEINDSQLAKLSRVALALLLALIGIYIVVLYYGRSSSFNLSYIALIPAIVIITFSHRRRSIIKGIDWSTIVFFLALFVLVGSVWQSGFFQSLISGLNLDIGSIPIVLGVSVVGSQFISNVPMVLLYLKLLSYSHISTSAAIALAAGSTIAGNLSILGAASNVIIIQGTEKRGAEPLSFMDFARIGVILTTINVLVYWAFLTL